MEKVTLLPFYLAQTRFVLGRFLAVGARYLISMIDHYKWNTRYTETKMGFLFLNHIQGIFSQLHLNSLQEAKDLS